MHKKVLRTNSSTELYVGRHNENKPKAGLLFITIYFLQ